MALDPNAERHARDLLGREVDAIHLDHLRAHDRINSDFSSRRCSGSSAHFDELRAADVEKTRRIAAAMLRTSLEAHESAGSRADGDDVREIERMIDRQCRAGSRESADTTVALMSAWGSLSSSSDCLTAIERDFATLQTELHADLRRKALEEEVGRRAFAAPGPGRGPLLEEMRAAGWDPLDPSEECLEATRLRELRESRLSDGDRIGIAWLVVTARIVRRFGKDRPLSQHGPEFFKTGLVFALSGIRTDGGPASELCERYWPFLYRWFDGVFLPSLRRLDAAQASGQVHEEREKCEPAWSCGLLLRALSLVDTSPDAGFAARGEHAGASEPISGAQWDGLLASLVEDPPGR